MLQPKRTKYRKVQKTIKKLRKFQPASRGTKVSFGEFGLKAVTCGRVSARQIEAARRAMTRHVKRGGKVWIRIFPDKPITKKPLEVRQGKGKGNVDRWVAVVKRGRIVCEIDGVDPIRAQEILKQVTYKLSFKTKFVKKDNGTTAA